MPKTSDMPHVEKQRRKEPDNIVERFGKQLVPPTEETDDDELEDPGTMTPLARPTDNRS